MDCPRCHSGLRDVRGIFVCLACGGAFLPSTARDAVARALDPVSQQTAALAGIRGTADVDTAARTPCPICRQPMPRFSVGGVDVDNCAAHGSWYDRGELEVVADALAAGASGVAVAAPTPAPAPPAPSLELQQRTKKKPPKPPKSSATTPQFQDPGAAAAIAKLIKHEHREAREQRRHHDRHHRHGNSSVAHDVADLIGDLLR